MIIVIIKTVTLIIINIIMRLITLEIIDTAIRKKTEIIIIITAITK